MASIEASLLSQIERVPVGTLELYPGNPRRGDVKAIAASLGENGQYAPLVVQASTRRVLAGNHTLKAARDLGWEAIDVVLVDVDDQRARKILLSDNRTQELGEGYDQEALAELLASLDGDWAGTGWDAQDVDGLADALGRDAPAGGGDAPEDDLPEAWGVIVECRSEREQAALLAELDGRGHKVRALMA